MKILTKNTLYKTILSLFLMLGTTAFVKADVIRLTVKEDLASCTGVAPQTCFQVKYKNSKNWEFFYSQIKGFNYKPGYRYVIDVTRTKRKNVPADASAYTYKLKKVVKKQKIATKKADNWAFVTKHNWKLIQINGQMPKSTTAYLSFQADKNAMSGSGGCNRIFGGFELKDNQITFKGIASTKMACADADKSKLESDFLKLLSDNSFRYDIADQTLNFYKDNQLVLMFGMTPKTK